MRAGSLASRVGAARNGWRARACKHSQPPKGGRCVLEYSRPRWGHTCGRRDGCCVGWGPRTAPCERDRRRKPCPPTLDAAATNAANTRCARTPESAGAGGSSHGGGSAVPGRQGSRVVAWGHASVRRKQPHAGCPAALARERGARRGVDKGGRAAQKGLGGGHAATQAQSWGPRLWCGLTVRPLRLAARCARRPAGQHNAAVQHAGEGVGCGGPGGRRLAGVRGDGRTWGRAAGRHGWRGARAPGAGMPWRASGVLRVMWLRAVCRTSRPTRSRLGTRGREGVVPQGRQDGGAGGAGGHGGSCACSPGALAAPHTQRSWCAKAARCYQAGTWLSGGLVRQCRGQLQMLGRIHAGRRPRCRRARLLVRRLCERHHGALGAPAARRARAQPRQRRAAARWRQAGPPQAAGPRAPPGRRCRAALRCRRSRCRLRASCAECRPPAAVPAVLAAGSAAAGARAPSAGARAGVNVHLQ